MTTDDNVPEVATAAATGPTDVATARRAPGSLQWPAIIIALVACGISAYLYLAVDRIESALDLARNGQQQLATLDSSVTAMRAELARSNEELAGLRTAQSATVADLNAVQQRLQQNNFDWLLAEVENLLIIANQHLTLDQDVTVALAALQAADDRLHTSDDARLLATRKQLAADINALQSVRPVDISGLALFLIDIAARVDKLPLKPLPENATSATEPAISNETQPAATPPFWRRLGTAILNTLKDMVRVYHTQNGTPTMLVPEQRYHIYQNLNLQLETATHAVLRRETQNFHAAVTMIQSWLREHFDASDPAVVNILDSLGRMSAVELRPPLPAIDSSMETLRALIRETTADPQPAATSGAANP